MKYSIITNLALGLVIFISSYASAEVNINGFASIRGGVMFDENSEQGQVPYTEDLSFKDESLFALQASFDLEEGLTATMQLMAEGKNDFDVEAQWAYISYQFNDSHKLNAGRLVNPLYYQSEYEKVGYTNNYVRLPKAVYQSQYFNTIEGMSLNSNFYFAGMDLNTTLLYGNWNGQAFLSSTSSFAALGIEQLMGINFELSKDWWKIYSGGWVAEINFADFDRDVVSNIAQSNLDSGDSGIVLKGEDGEVKAEYQSFINTIGWHTKDTFYSYAGFGIDYSGWLFDAEYTRAGIWDATDAIDEGYYVAIGHRMGDFVVTVHVEDFKQDADTGLVNSVSDPDLKAAGAFVETLFSTRKFDMHGVSVRYDFHAGAALKLDYFCGDSHTGDFDGMSFGIDLVF